MIHKSILDCGSAFSADVSGLCIFTQKALHELAASGDACLISWKWYVLASSGWRWDINAELSLDIWVQQPESPLPGPTKGKMCSFLAAFSFDYQGYWSTAFFLALSPAIFTFLQIGMVCKWYWVLLLLINAFHGKSIFNTFTSQS